MSKGGTTSGSTEIPAWLEDAAIENINKARDVSQIGYVPYYGPDVAAFSPMQQQSMQSTGNAASAFGLAPQGFNAMAGMPQAETFAGGLQGYSSAPLYEQSLDKLFANAPAQYRALNQQFIDPFTGARPRSGYGATPMQVSQMASGGGGGGFAGISSAPAYTPATDGGTGYWQGGSRTGKQTQDMSDEEFEAYVLAEGLPSDVYTTGDALRGIGGNLLDSSLFGKLYEKFTGNLMSGGSPNAIVSDLSTQARAIDGGLNPTGGLLGSAVTTPLESANIISGNGYYGSGDQYAQSLAAVQAAQSQARKQADEQASAIAMQNYLDNLEAQKASMAPIVKRVQAASPTVAALRSTVNDGPQWSPSVNSSDASAPKASYSRTGKNGYNFGL